MEAEKSVPQTIWSENFVHAGIKPPAYPSAAETNERGLKAIAPFNSVHHAWCSYMDFKILLPKIFFRLGFK
jgi:hypothetical protein